MRKKIKKFYKFYIKSEIMKAQSKRAARKKNFSK